MAATNPILTGPKTSGAVEAEKLLKRASTGQPRPARTDSRTGRRQGTPVSGAARLKGGRA